MMGTLLAIGLAFVAGLASFASPCVLPLIPAYIAMLAGDTGVSGEIAGRSRIRLIVNAAAFVLGFSTMFVLMGMAVGAAGGALSRYMPLIRRLGGVFVVAMGLATAGWLPLPLVSTREARFNYDPGDRANVFVSFVFGIVFGVAWTPCAGPALASILVMAQSFATASRAMVLLGAYSLGLGVPFLLAAVFLAAFRRRVMAMARYADRLRVVTGLLLVALGLLVYFNLFSRISSLFS